ncbi:MAG: peptidoglycan-binding protein LysM [Pseudomonas sp. PGPPP3]|nr:MAG: peptidoglycan-binding protein LysM [Pseudomonas sp. PGPPP3]
MVPALGLGAITLHSALNQPLEADIELLQMGGLDSDDIRVRLASDADFARSGVDRLFFLNDLRFTPLLRGNRHVIRVVSSKPVQEPYLNFIIEVARPNGQLLREYTVLLDPPSSSAYSAMAAAPVVQRSRANIARPAATVVVDLPPATQGQRYTVQRGDSLWLIAQRLREAGSGLSQSALMEGLYGLNPQAFLGGDKNRLSLGADLLLPDAAASVQRVAAPAAVADARPIAPASSPDIAQTAVPARDETQQRVDQELAQRAEENRQLQASMLALQAQLQALQEQMQAKDQQLELLRADQASVDQAVAPAAVNSPAAVVTPVENAPVVADLPVDASPLGWHWPVAGISLLLGALAGLALWRRRRQPEAEVVAAEAEPAPAQVAVLAPIAATVPVVAAPVAPPTPAAEADALDGANIYIAYGRFGEALMVLRKAIEQAPQRSDLRLRLLSVLGELGDGAGFNQEEAELRRQGVELEQLDHLRARYASRLLAVPHAAVPEPLEDAVLLLDEAVHDNTPTALDEFQLNLHDLSLPTDWEDLRQLPEVCELSAEQEADSVFADWPVTHSKEDLLLDESFTDAFAQDSVKRSPAAELSDLQHLASNRQNLIKLNKALAYIEQGDLASACDILNEVIIEGDDEQKLEARALLARIA